MSIEGLIAALIITAGALWVVVMPLLRRDYVPQLDDDLVIQKQRERLLVYYERVLTNIRDLDEDHATGKMPTSDYEGEREEWVWRGVQVLKSLDELDGHHALVQSMDEGAIDRTIDAAIERVVAAHRKSAAH